MTEPVALREATLGQLLDETVARFPHREALVYVDRNYRMTWRQLGEQTDRLARGLMAMGVQKGEKVAIWATNVPDWVLVMFATAKGNKIHPSSLRRDALRPALERAGITKRIRFHDLRHTFASILIHHGHDKAYVAEQMGHSSPNVTERIYGHLFDREKKREEARAKMEAEFGQVLGN